MAGSVDPFATSDSEAAALTDLAALAAELGTTERDLHTILVSGEVPGAVYLPDRRAWHLPAAVLEQLRRRA